MAIPESQLDVWAHQGSVIQSSTTYATIRQALASTDTEYAGIDFQIFLQGSYGNDTNIYSESDVDVVIRLDDIYYHDASELTALDLATFNQGFIAGTYAYVDYKKHVIAALTKRFGAAAIKVGTKAITIEADGNRRRADVIVATEFRSYYSSSLGPRYHSGICFFTASGNRIENYPKQHSANCTLKHQATNGWFKPMVRIFKNMRGRLLDKGLIEQGGAPSYFLEGLLYNVPNTKFGSSF